VPDTQAPIARKPRRVRISRDEKARVTRISLLNAGCTVVAAEGYAAASIAKIADLAGVAHGTFYNYFDDRQSLFNELLPYEGLRMREEIETLARPVPSGMLREFARFEAFLNYVIEHEGFYRVLYEAEIFAPDAHRAHMKNIIDGYKGTFGRAMEEGRMRQLSLQQIECLIYQILGMRAYVAMQINFEGDLKAKLAIRDAALETYRLLIGHSLLVPTAE
jgi:AcrR family transcriptional regulator